MERIIHSAATAVGLSLILAVGCSMPSDGTGDDEQPGPSAPAGVTDPPADMTETQRPVGTPCGEVAIACLDEFARSPINLICFRETSRWDHFDLTWHVATPAEGLEDEAQIDAVRRALDAWADVSNLTFREVDAGDEADLTVSFDDGDPFPFDGPGNNLGYAFFPGTPRAGEIHLCRQESWSLEPAPDRFDVFTTVLHEVGHALGVEHSTDDTTVMAPSYPEMGVTLLTEADVTLIQRLYGAPGEEVPAIPPIGEGFCSEVGDLNALGDPESDGDGIPDSVEAFALGTNPFEADSDGDGASDLIEVFTADPVLRSDPLNADSDGDGSLDGDDPEPLNDRVVGTLRPPPVTGTDALSMRIFVDGRQTSAFTLSTSNVTLSDLGLDSTTDEYALIVQQQQQDPDDFALDQVTFIFRNRAAVSSGANDASDLNGYISVAVIEGTLDFGAVTIPNIHSYTYCNCDCPSFGGTTCRQINQSSGVGPPTGTIDLRLSGGRLTGSFDFSGIEPVANATLRVVGSINLPDTFFLGDSDPNGGP